MFDVIVKKVEDVRYTVISIPYRNWTGFRVSLTALFFLQALNASRVQTVDVQRLGFGHRVSSNNRVDRLNRFADVSLLVISNPSLLEPRVRGFQAVKLLTI